MLTASLLLLFAPHQILKKYTIIVGLESALSNRTSAVTEMFYTYVICGHGEHEM